MTLFLRQSTAIDIRMGPFVDATDAVTPETGITLGAADQAEVLKENGAATVAMGGTFAAVTDADGWYDYTVASGDVDTVGEVVFVVQDLSVCLPVAVRAFVVEEAVYDAMYNASAVGPLTAAAVNAQVVDVLKTDTNSTDGLTGAPPESPNMEEAIGYLYKAFRNKMTTTTTLLSIFDNAGSTVDHKATVSESGGTTTKEEMASGP